MLYGWPPNIVIASKLIKSWWDEPWQSRIPAGGGGSGDYEKLIWRSHEQIIPFYFLYEILKEAIFFKKIS